TEAELRVPRAAVGRHQHADGERQVGRQAAQHAPLHRRLAHQADVALLEVAHAAVDQLRAAARGARGPVEALDERDPEPAQRRIARHAGARDAAADDEEIERGGGKDAEGRLARLGGERRGHGGNASYRVARSSLRAACASATLSARPCSRAIWSALAAKAIATWRSPLAAYSLASARWVVKSFWSPRCTQRSGD